jgi:uncharacterized protein YndB with AHSA1/START domain
MSAVEQSIVVRVDPEDAFRAWTDRVALWWPPDHRISGDPDGEMVMEAREGGRFFERTSDGRELDYGRVIECSPPERLRYAFFLGGGKDSPTSVIVTFTAIAEGTRVDVHHDVGEMPQERFDQAVTRFRGGWSKVAAAFTAYGRNASFTPNGPAA